MELAPLVVNVIARRFGEKSHEFRLLTDSKSGFEDWCTAEAYIACRQEEGWIAHLFPRYADEKQGHSGYGDVRVSAVIDGEERWTFIEIVLISDGNRKETTWQRKKLREDVEQLRCIPWEYDLPLLMVLDTTLSNGTQPHWLAYLDGLPISRKLFHVERPIPYQPSGQLTMHVFGICRPGISSE